jgi:hypothetical protein
MDSSVEKDTSLLMLGSKNNIQQSQVGSRNLISSKKNISLKQIGSSKNIY